MSASRTSHNANYPTFPPGFVSEVRRLTHQLLVPLVQRHVKLARAGNGQWKGCCPFHCEKTPSFFVYGDGHYHCFGCQAHGDAIQFLRQADGRDFRDAVVQLAGDAGLAVPDGTEKRETAAERRTREERIARQQVEQQRARDAELAAHLATDTVKAQQILAGTVDWRGTPAARNWHVVRGIPEAAANRSTVLRWHPAEHALVVVATTADGAPTSGQLIKLRRDGENLTRRSNGRKIKLTFGRPTATDALARLPGNASLPLLIGEGPENADSAASLTGAEAWVAFGSLERVEPPAGRDTIALSDGDDPNKPAAIALEAWVAHWRKLGRRIVIARPLPEWTGRKLDFNDLLREQGRDAVLARIEAARAELRDLVVAELAALNLAPADPPFPLPTATPTEVRAATFHAVHSFFLQRAMQPPPRIVVPGATGSGKTEAAGQLLPHIIAADKAERSLPGRENTPYRAIVMVPAHSLGRQIAERYEALGLNVAILEGRGDPWKPEKPSRPYLCKNLEAVGLALTAHEDVRSAVCGSKKGKRRCPFFDSCGYLAQFADASAADVLIVAHTFMFEQLPKSVLHDIAYVIIDEDFTPSADAITELWTDTFRKPVLERWPALNHDGEVDAEATERLIAHSEKLIAMFDDTPDGYLPDVALAKHGLTPQDFNYLRDLHWKRRREVGMHPGMTLQQCREALKQAEINQQLPRIATALRMLATGETARLRLFTDAKPDGVRRGVVLHGQRKVSAWLREKPVLMLNASARRADVRRFFGDAVMIPLPQARLEHQRVHQVLGSFGKSAMTEHKLDGLVTEARAHVAAGRTVLVIVHEQCEATFQGLPGIRVLHHGNIAGDDDNGDVDVVMQIGGPFAKHAKMAELATARYGVPVPIAQPVRRPCVALMEDGTGVQFDRMAYEHPASQAVHEGIYDQAFVQGGLGRGRGINRSAATQLEIWIYGNAPLPVPLASLRRWEPLREKALLAAGSTHSNGRDLYRFHGTVFPSEAAAEKWRQRNPFDEPRLRGLLADDPRPHVKITWKPTGQGHKARQSIVPACDAAAFRRQAEREFGGLQHWAEEQFTRGAASKEADIAPMTLHRGMSASSTEVVASGWPVAWERAEIREHPPDG